jgi:hypothetical protein
MENPFEAYVSLALVNGRLRAALDGWEMPLDLNALDIMNAVTEASDAALRGMQNQSRLKPAYLTKLCREAKEEIPVWNIRARRQFDQNMIQWLSAKEAELEKAAKEKVSANQQ